MKADLNPTSVVLLNEYGLNVLVKRQNSLQKTKPNYMLSRRDIFKTHRYRKDETKMMGKDTPCID